MSAPPSAGQTVRNDTTYTYFDNGWTRTSTDPWDIVTTYDYNDIGKQTARTLTSAGGSSSRTMTWDYYPDGKLKSRSDDGVPVGKQVVLVDNSDVQNTATTGTWPSSTSAGGFQGIDYQTHAAGTGANTFTWNLTIPQDGTYQVFVRYPAASATNAQYTVTASSGTTTTATVNQQTNPGQWVPIGSFTFTADGTGQKVTLTDAANGTVAADAVKLVRDNTGEADNENTDFGYTYDPNGNLVDITDTSPGTQIDDYAVTYDGIDRVTKVEEKLAGLVKHTTSYTYNENSNPLTLTHDTRVDTYEYDARDLVSKVTNATSTTDPDPKVTTFTYTTRAQVDHEVKGNGNTVDYTYFLNKALQHQIEKKPDGTVVAEHTYDYDPNGNQTTDTSKVQNADNHTAYINRVATSTYDPRDRLATVTKTDAGSTVDSESYTHDANNNVITQTLNATTTDFTYDRNRLLKATTAGATANYNYDPFGRLDTVTAGGQLVERNSYDGFDHITKHTKQTSGGGTTTSTYTYDPLDRTTTETTNAGTPSAKTTDFTYLGLTDQVLDENVAGQITKTYQYTPWGQRLSQVVHNTDGTTEDGYYGYNAHTDVEDVTTSTGDTKTTYGYTAYGSDDTTQSSGIDTPDPQNPGAQPYNVYRFNAKRFDPATGTYDMGFRDYNPNLNQFLTRDMYNGALLDMGLTANPFTGNRYAYGAGNPVSNVELDGHVDCSAPDGYNCGGAQYEGYDSSGTYYKIGDAHDAAVKDSVPLIEQRMKERGISGTITVDLNAEGKKANTIPGAARDGSGKDGIADIILWAGDDVYIWEVKSRGGNTKVGDEWIPNIVLGPIQLDRYVRKLQAKLDAEGKNVTVHKGFGFATSETIFKNKAYRTWSGSDKTSEAGIRFYHYDGEPRVKQPQEQEQEQEQEKHAPAAGCARGPFVALGPCLPQVYPGPNINMWPIPVPQGIPMPIPIPGLAG